MIADEVVTRGEIGGVEASWNIVLRRRLRGGENEEFALLQQRLEVQLPNT
ncbi:hypothetical protein Scep_028325 [Stephania cephalantha]|uniref:Uncharacterized protein n=1 Tax=Stephania cephalantha TaxID=152367 RepID=A0AAP0EH42_9MAGN